MVKDVSILKFRVYYTNLDTKGYGAAQKKYITVDVAYRSGPGVVIKFPTCCQRYKNSEQLENLLKFKKGISCKLFVPGLWTAFCRYASSGKANKTFVKIQIFRLLVKQALELKKSTRRGHAHKIEREESEKKTREIERSRLFFTERRELPLEVLRASRSVTVKDGTFIDGANILRFGSSTYKHMRYFADYDHAEKLHFPTRSRRWAAKQAAELLMNRFRDIMNNPDYIFVELKAGVNPLWKQALNKLRRGPAHVASAEDAQWLQRYSEAQAQTGIQQSMDMRKLKHELRTIRWTKDDLRSSTGKRMPMTSKFIKLFEALMISERPILDAIVWLPSQGIFVEMSNVFIFTFGDGEPLSHLFKPIEDVLKSLAEQVQVYTVLTTPYKAATRLASLLRLIIDAESGVSTSSMEEAIQALWCLQLLFKGKAAQIRQVYSLVNTLLNNLETVANTPEFGNRIILHLNQTRQKLDTIQMKGNMSYSSSERLRQCSSLISEISAPGIANTPDTMFRQKLEKVEKILVNLTNEAVQGELQRYGFGFDIFQTIAERMEQAVCSTATIRKQTEWLMPACDSAASARVLGLLEERQAP
jgi:hypothetical protein